MKHKFGSYESAIRDLFITVLAGMTVGVAILYVIFEVLP